MVGLKLCNKESEDVNYLSKKEKQNLLSLKSAGIKDKFKIVINI
jgi:hypothetical protein